MSDELTCDRLIVIAAFRYALGHACDEKCWQRVREAMRERAY